MSVKDSSMMEANVPGEISPHIGMSTTAELIDNGTLLGRDITDPLRGNIYRKTTQKSDTNGKPYGSMRHVCCNSNFLFVLPVVLLWVLAGYIPAVFMPLWASQWFAGCTQIQKDNDECEPDYASTIQWNAIFGAIGGLLALCFGGYMGRISDSIGRKPFFIFNCIVSGAQFAPLIFWRNMWIKLPLQALAGLNISDNSLTPSMAAYLADTFEKEYRTIAFGLAYAVGGIGLLAGATTAILVEIFWDVETNFLAITMFNVLQFIWIILFLPESLDRKDRKPLTQKSIQNPLRPLWQARSHPIAIWISIVQLCASLPESGIVEISTAVILDQLESDVDLSGTTISAIFVVSCGIGLLIGMAIVLPILKKHFSDIWVLIISSIISIVSYLLMGCITYFPHMIFVVLSGIFITMGMISFPAANGLVSKYISKQEQGIGFGVILAVRSISWVIAPVMFGLSYNYFNDISYPEITFFIASLFGLTELIVVIIPLRRSLNYAIKTGTNYTFSKYQLITKKNNEYLTL